MWFKLRVWWAGKFSRRLADHLPVEPAKLQFLTLR
jgi:hypothetical protein